MKTRIATTAALFLFMLAGASRSYALLGAGDIVFDPAAYAQLVSSYSVTIKQYMTQAQQYATQIQQLQNQYQQLRNDAQNLVNLNWQAPLTDLNHVGQIMQSANGIASTFATAQAQFQKLYPDFNSYSGMRGTTYVQQASNWQNQNRNAALDTIRVQAMLRDAYVNDLQSLNSASSRSANAQGARDALQATNQLLALVTKQLMQLQQLLSSSASMDASFAAEKASQSAAATANLRSAFQGWRNKGSRNVVLHNDLLH